MRIPLIVFSVAFFISSQPAHAELACQQLPAIFSAFEQQHYMHPPLDVGLEQRTAVQFVKLLDPSKTELLAADAEKIKSDVVNQFEGMTHGDCIALEQAYQLVVNRAADDHTIAEQFLGPTYKLDETTEIVVDPDKRGYAKTDAERTMQLKRFIHFQISNYLTSGQTLAQAKEQLIHRYSLVLKRFKDRQQKGMVVSLFADAFAQALDPHSSYMSADTLANFQIELSLSLEGIGAVLSSQDGFTRIESLVPGGQADKSGKLRPKDKIMAVAQQGEAPVATLDMDLEDVVKMIRGPKGTQVTLTILREGDKARTFQVVIVRDKVDVKSQAAKIDYQTRHIGTRVVTIGVIDLPSFYGGEKGGRWSHNDVKNLLDQAKAKQVDGIVLDLTRNGGGLLEEAVRISGLFIKHGAVVGTQDSTGRLQVLEDEDDSVEYSGPLVVLTSPISASASEILAGALEDYHRALIVGGVQTFGKGTVQTLMPLSTDLGAIKVTVGMFFLPGGASTQQRGVPADIALPTLYDNADLTEAKLDNSLPPQTVQAFLSASANGSGPSHWVPVNGTEVNVLADKSKARMATDKGFAQLKAKLNETKDKGVVKLSELHKKKDGKVVVEKDGSSKAEDDEVKTLEAVDVKEAVNISADQIAYEHHDGTVMNAN